LKKRRKAKKPVIPIPRRDIEAGSGISTEVILTEMVPVAPLETPVRLSAVIVTGGEAGVSKVKWMNPPATGVKVIVTMSVEGVSVTPERFVDVTVRPVIGATGEYVSSMSLAVPVGGATENDTSVVTIDSALADVAHARLARAPKAKARGSNRFFIQITPQKQ
jgi:hypothetical protein